MMMMMMMMMMTRWSRDDMATPLEKEKEKEKEDEENPRSCARWLYDTIRSHTHMR